MHTNQELLQETILFVQKAEYISASILQRNFLIGYQEATELIQLLIKNKICVAEFTTGHGYLIHTSKEI